MKTSFFIFAACISSLFSAQTSYARDEVVGNKGNKYLIINNGTSISWAEKTNTGSHLIKTLASGEQCNGGISKFKNWQYAINLTPVDILSQGSGAPLKMDSYRDLDAGAQSCIGQAIYQFDPDTQMAKLLHVKLSKKEMTMEPWVLDLNYQYCFNRLFNSYLYRGQIILTQTDLDRFKNQFESICMASGR